MPKNDDKPPVAPQSTATSSAAPVASAAAPADLDALRAENERLRAANEAQRAQSDEILDALVDMREEISALKANHGAAPVVDENPSVDAQLDAEWQALKDEFSDVPNIQVLDHRMTVGVDAVPALRLRAAPGGMPEPSITDDPHGDHCYWKLRWFNFAIEGRAEKFVSEGYLKVERSELLDPEAIPNLSGIDNYVRKGERGQDVLGKIPRKIFEFKKRRDAVKSGRLMTSESGLRDHVANRVAGMAGAQGQNADQAGSFVHDKKGFQLTVKQGPKETVTI